VIRLLVVSIGILAATPVAFGKNQRVSFVQTLKPQAKGVVDVWIPIPLGDQPYQKIISQEMRGNATFAKFVRVGANESPALHVHWDNVEAPEFQLTNMIELSERSAPMTSSKGVELFLQPTKHVQTDGIVAETAKSIVGKTKDSDQKARAIYEWMVARAVRDPETRGCGVGDVKSTLSSGSLRGKCVDINSVFVGLARAVGVPAREVFGQRVLASEVSASLGKEGDVSKTQHCRAEYYSTKLGGWVPVDPADVAKVALEEKLAIDSPRLKQIKERLFGWWENNWVAFNFDRDFVIQGYATEPINYFLYPRVVAKSFQPDGIDPKETGYEYFSKLM